MAVHREPSKIPIPMKNNLSLFLVNIFFAATCFCQTQTIRGTVTDVANDRPLAGASIVLLNSTPPMGIVTDTLGHYRLDNVPIGRHQLQVSYVGFETMLISGLLVETGKEFIQDVQLNEFPSALGEVTVRASGTPAPSPVSSYQLKVEEQSRYPTTYYDPARLVLTLPSVRGVDDQGNSISVRGNSPATVRWRLEGVDIVNPNHTANAGTFSDRPTAAGGGISILSTQLLGTSNFLTGAFPAGYGNAIGGLMDMRLRNGNDQKHEFTAQAGVIGLEAAAEGPVGRRTGDGGREMADGGRRTGSYLVNYRYSFVGLLTAAGVDFGGEEISFQDFSFHLNFPVLKNAELGFFGMGGLSKNSFKSPLETDKIEEDKDRFNIDFDSKMGATGLTFNSPVGKQLKVKLVAAVSGLEHERTADLVVNVPQKTRWSEDNINENKIALSGNISYKKNARNGWDLGIQATRERSGFYTLFSDNFGSQAFGGEVSDWLLQTYLVRHTYIFPKLKLTTGIHWFHFRYTFTDSNIQPRASLTFTPNERQKITLAYSSQGQIQQPQTYLAKLLPPGGIGNTKSRQIVAAYQRIFRNETVLKAEVYNQEIFDVPVSARAGSTYSTLNDVETFRLLQDTLTDTGKGHNYGIDVLLESPILTNSFARLGASLYRSLYTANDGIERPTRFDGRYLINATSGSEKVKKKNGKTIVRGHSTRISWYGGFRQTPIDEAASAELGYTVFEEEKANSIKLKDYFRIDYRFYWKINKPNRSTTLSLDIQNLSNRKNEAYLYFDNVQQRVVTKKQLGLIPFLNYRVEF